MGLIISSFLNLSKDVLSYVLQGAAAVGTLFLAYMTYGSLEEVRKERLRKSFIAIVEELHRVKRHVNESIKKLGNLNESKVEPLIRLDVGGFRIDKETVRTDFALHYKRGLKLLKLIGKCNTEVEKYNEEYNKLKDALRSIIVERLEEEGVKVDSSFSSFSQFLLS